MDVYIEKYIDRVTFNYPIAGLASVFHIDGATATDEFELISLEEFTELAYKMVVYDTTNERLNVKNGGNSNNVIFAAALERKEYTKDRNRGADITSVGDKDQKKILLEYLGRLINLEL